MPIPILVPTSKSVARVGLVLDKDCPGCGASTEAYVVGLGSAGTDDLARMSATRRATTLLDLAPCPRCGGHDRAARGRHLRRCLLVWCATLAVAPIAMLACFAIEIRGAAASCFGLMGLALAVAALFGAHRYRSDSAAAEAQIAWRM